MEKTAYRKNQMVTDTAVHEENWDGEGMGAIFEGNYVTVYSPYGVDKIAATKTMEIIEAMEKTEISKHLIVEFSSKIHDATPPTPADDNGIGSTMEFYGNENETGVATRKGIFLIQNPDMAGDYEKIDEIPSSWVRLPEYLCHDIFVPDEII